MAWYETMFEFEDPIRAQMYAQSDESRMQVSFLIDKLGLQPGMRILDLCCGQGRHLIDFVRRGYDIVGADLSGYMLSKCREFAAKEGIEPKLVQCDMRDIDFDSEFDACINMFTSFGYLESDDEDQKVLNHVAKALKPGGLFVIHTMNRDRLMSVFRERDWQENERGEMVCALRDFDPVTGRINAMERVIGLDGSRRETSHSIRLYAFTELEKMLKDSGMAVREAFGDFDGSQYGRQSSRMIVVAEKVASSLA